jgi:hypothetical protein
LNGLAAVIGIDSYPTKLHPCNFAMEPFSFLRNSWFAYGFSPRSASALASYREVEARSILEPLEEIRQKGREGEAHPKTNPMAGAILRPASPRCTR